MVICMSRTCPRRETRTVTWFQSVLWGLCALSGCATSTPERAATPAAPKMILLNGQLEPVPARGTISIGAVRHTCLIDADVSPEDRQPVEAVALSFVAATLGSNPSEAYAMMAAEARAVESNEAFSAAMHAAQREMGQYRDLRVAHTYLIESTGDGAAERAVCGRLASRRWISVALRPERKQAYVVMSARTQNSDWDLTVWLVPDEGKWAVESFNTGVASLAGRSADDVLQLARNEKTAGHGFNAFMLHVALRALIERGPNLQLAIAQEAIKDVESLPVPPEVRGPPPFTWNLGGKECVVERATILGIEGKLGLIFMLPLTTWSGEDAADKYNREFLVGFIAAHPDYARVFEFLVARALTPDKSGGFGTVYKLGQGFK
jgi:hypothetical protein